jgi:hypothetical protein
MILNHNFSERLPKSFFNSIDPSATSLAGRFCNAPSPSIRVKALAPARASISEPGSAAADDRSACHGLDIILSSSLQAPERIGCPMARRRGSWATFQRFTDKALRPALRRSHEAAKCGTEINWRYSVPEQMQLIDGKYCSQPASAGAAPPSPWPVALWQWAQFSV